MPTLPVPDEAPAGPVERLSEAARRAGAAIGADARVTLRALIALWVMAAVLVTTPEPWGVIGALALVTLCIDWARTKVR